MSVLSIVALSGAVFVALVWWLNEWDARYLASRTEAEREEDEDRQAW